MVYDILHKIDIPHPTVGELQENWARKQEIKEMTYNLLNEFTLNKKLIDDLSQKYKSLYQRAKNVYQNITSRTVSAGYELESSRVTDTFSYKKFFKYNKTFSKACNNFLNRSKEEIDYNIANWRIKKRTIEECFEEE